VLSTTRLNIKIKRTAIVKNSPCWCYQQQAFIDNQIRCNILVVVITNKTPIKFQPLQGLQLAITLLFFSIIVVPASRVRFGCNGIGFVDGL